MSETTNIAWADSTFNPWLGCTKVGPGCDGCYAEALMDRRMGRVKWGAGEKRQRTSEAYWRQPLAWDRKARESGQPWRVFCASLADVFDNEVPRAWRAELFDIILKTPHLTWMLLTKRIGNAPKDFIGLYRGTRGWPSNVWLGATVVNQEEADRDIPKLLQVPAAVRFLSIEPMLGPIDLSGFTTKVERGMRVADGWHDVRPGIDWVIVGGESDQPGHRARPFNIEWARDIVRQCTATQVPAFVKQLGSRPNWCAMRAHGDDQAGEHYCDAYEAHECSAPCEGRCVMLVDRAGADPSEWPEDLRVRETPR